MSDPTSLSYTLIAWAVAGSLAAGVGGAAFGLIAYRRRRDMESRLHALEETIEDFCSALRSRLELERSRSHSRQPAASDTDTHEAA